MRFFESRRRYFQVMLVREAVVRTGPLTDAELRTADETYDPTMQQPVKPWWPDLPGTVAETLNAIHQSVVKERAADD